MVQTPCRSALQTRNISTVRGRRALKQMSKARCVTQSAPKHVCATHSITVESFERQNLIGQALGLQIAHQGTDAKPRATRPLPFEDSVHFVSLVYTSLNPADRSETSKLCRMAAAGSLSSDGETGPPQVLVAQACEERRTSHWSTSLAFCIFWRCPSSGLRSGWGGVAEGNFDGVAGMMLRLSVRSADVGRE